MFSLILPGAGALNDQERTIELILSYNDGRCGICEELGAEVIWFSPFSRHAHSVCYRKIIKIEADLMANIESIFENTIDRNNAHIRAVGAVLKALNGITIKTYLERNGSKMLKLIFDLFGLDAALSLRPKL